MHEDSPISSVEKGCVFFSREGGIIFNDPNRISLTIIETHKSSYEDSDFLFLSVNTNKSVTHIKTKTTIDKSIAGFLLRRGRDSNPRYTFGVHTLSKRAP